MKPNWRRIRFIVIMALAVIVVLLAIANEVREADAFSSFMGGM